MYLVVKVGDQTSALYTSIMDAVSLSIAERAIVFFVNSESSTPIAVVKYLIGTGITPPVLPYDDYGQIQLYDTAYGESSLVATIMNSGTVSHFKIMKVTGEPGAYIPTAGTQIFEGSVGLTNSSSDLKFNSVDWVADSSIILGDIKLRYNLGKIS